MITKNSSLGDIYKYMLDEAWSNSACIGYAIKACVMADLPHDKICEIVRNLNLEFEDMTVGEAERFYQDF